MNTSEALIPMLLSFSGAVTFFAGPQDHEDFMRVSRVKIGDLRDRSRVHQRLTSLGREGDYEQFRIKQLTHCLFTSALVFMLMSILQRSVLLLGISAAVAGCFSFNYEDRRLSSAVKKQRLQIEAEFASVIEMMTLAISAGETPLGAISRISQRSDGPFSHELTKVVDSVKSGTPFHLAIDALGRRIDSVAIRRFVDALITAMLRGAPLVELLHSHVAEARLNQKNIIMDKAGKAEMSMMIPVVFLILPISVLFALWPSLTNLNVFAS